MNDTEDLQKMEMELAELLGVDTYVFALIQQIDKIDEKILYSKHLSIQDILLLQIQKDLLRKNIKEYILQKTSLGL